MSVETRYARARDDTHVAYQVSGAGPIDIVFLRGWLSQVEHEWDEPVLARILRRLGPGARVIRFDRRGSGLSDRPPSALPTIEDRVDDLLAVLDAADSSRAVFVGLGDGCALLMVATAAHPERCARLVLYSPRARGSWAPDYPWQANQEEFDASLGRIRNLTRREMAERLVRLGAPSRTDDEALVAWFAEDLRRIGTTEEIVALRRLVYESDVRGTLESLHVPVLVLAREGTSVDEAKAVAHQIPGARFVPLPGDDEFVLSGDTDAFIREVTRFAAALTERDEEVEDRVLATVLFTDIVGSTAMAGKLGDRQWAATLERYHASSAELVTRERGRIVDTSGDGMLAAFDGPGRAIRCARALVAAAGSRGLRIRAGLHAGECELVDGRLRGMTVHIGARVAALASASEILVSRTVRDLVAGSGIGFEPRGPRTLKGVEGRWDLFAVTSDARRARDGGDAGRSVAG